MNKIKQLRQTHTELVSKRMEAITSKQPEQVIEDIESQRLEIWRELMRATNEYFEIYDDIRAIRIINNSKDE
jgi:hypothetical protein